MEKFTYIQIMVKGTNTPKGLRKSRPFLFNLYKIYDADLMSLDGEMLKNKAIEELKRMNKVDSAYIIFRRASEDSGMVFTELFSSVPVKSIKVI